MRELLILLLAGLGTYALRAAFLATARERPPGPLGRLLPHVGPAVLGAVTVPALLAPHGTLAVGDTAPALLAAAVAGGLWWRTRSMPVALFSGLAISWLAAGVLA